MPGHVLSASRLTFVPVVVRGAGVGGGKGGCGDEWEGEDEGESLSHVVSPRPLSPRPGDGQKAHAERG